MELRLAGPEDAEAIRAIYNPEVTDTTVTFDMVPRTVDEQLAWIEAHGGAHPAVVAILDGEVIGFGSLSSFRDKAAYATTVEDSVYVRRDHQGKGVGKAILSDLVGLATDYGFHAMIARIVGDNGPSIGVHRACGFEMVGVEREVGRKLGQWLDVVEMQRLL
jgi:L-amino acid N-acyltransferase YncA